MRRKYLLIIPVIAASVVSALIPPLVLGYIVDLLADNKAVMFITAILYLGVIAVSGIFESLQNIMITVIGQRITHDIRSNMSIKLLRLPAGYFTMNETGGIVSRFVNDVDAVDTLFTNGIISMVADACKIISVLVIIFMRSLGLGIIMCIITPLLFGMTMFFQKKMKAAQIENRKAVARVNNHVPDTIKNIRMIRTYNCGRFMEDTYDSYIEDGYRAMDKSNLYDSLYSPIIVFTSAVTIAVMMLFAAGGEGARQLFGLTTGTAVAMIAYVGRIFDPLESLGMEIQNIQTALAGVTRIKEYMNEKEMILSEDNEEHKNEPLIEFQDVSFGYEDNREIISGFNISINRGENVIFTGRTGAGKSTVFKLILGLYRPNTGTVKVNGICADLITESDRRQIFGYVEQHFAVIDGTVRDQICMFDERYDDNQILDALSLCGLKDKILSMPNGLSTNMNLKDFSQGELQLMSIARALVAEPEIMLLDEMTANLDSHTEQKILHVIQEASKHRTVISISHRLAEDMDNCRIINM